MRSAPHIRISIVEDDPVIRGSIASLFTSEPEFDLIRTYANGELAMTGLMEDSPDIVFMDISMPGRSGIDVVRELVPTMPRTQFLMYTMHDDDERVFEALKAGASGYILKSSTPDQIIEAVRELLLGGAPMSTAVARRVIGHFRSVPDPERTGLGGEPLSDRENEVLKFLSQGLLYKEIAEKTNLSIGTIKQHIHRIYHKLHVNNRVEAANRYFGR